MRRIGAHVSTAGGLLQAIANTNTIGGNCLQIFAGSPRIWARSLFPAELAAEFRAQVAAQDLNPVYIHALYLTNLASDNPDLVAKSQQALIMDMTNSTAIGSAGVVLHIGSHQGRGWQFSLQQVIGAIREVLDRTPEDSYLLLENSAGQNGKIGSLAELADIFATVDSPRLRVCLDTAHAFEAGYDLGSDDGVGLWFNDIEKYIPGKLVVLHLNDSKTPLGSGRDMHANIGDGFIGTGGLARVVNHPYFARFPLILEVPGHEKQGPDKENIQRVQKILS